MTSAVMCPWILLEFTDADRVSGSYTTYLASSESVVEVLFVLVCPAPFGEVDVVYVLLRESGPALFAAQRRKCRDG